MGSSGLFDPHQQPLESSSSGSPNLRRVAIAAVSLGALIVLFFSFQGSDVSTKNGIVRRRLPPDVLEQVGGGVKDRPLSNSVSKQWLESQEGAWRGSEDRTNDYDDDYDDDDYAALSRTSSPASTPGAPPAKHKKTDQKDKKMKKKGAQEACEVNPAPRGVYVKGHGPCITQFPHQPAALGGMDDCWRLAFAVAQWEQPKNPSKAEFGDDWKATAKAYPHTARQAQQIVDDFNTKTELPISSEWSPNHPYVRLCVPTACGLSKTSGCELRKTDFLMHINPNSKDTDNTTHLFYKGFVRDGHLMLPNAGLTAH